MPVTQPDNTGRKYSRVQEHYLGGNRAARRGTEFQLWQGWFASARPVSEQHWPTRAEKKRRSGKQNGRKQR